MKKILLGITTMLVLTLSACDRATIKSSDNSSRNCGCSNATSKDTGMSNDSEEHYKRPDDWYTPRYYDYYNEPQSYESVLEFNYKSEKDKAELFEYLETVEEGKYIKYFPVQLNANSEVDPCKYYTSSFYNCCKEEYKRISLNCKFDLEHPYYNYGMSTDSYGDDYFHLKIDLNFYPGDIIFDKYYKLYTNEEISKEEFEEIQSKTHWKYTGHWSGNFVPSEEYKSYTRFDVEEVFFLCTRMFFSYDTDRNLDRVRIYERTPSSGDKIEIVGLKK